MHTYSEQFLLLSVDPVSGRMFPVPDQVLQLTLAGALLIDASFDSRINDDWEQLTVLQVPESGNSAVDGALRCLLALERSIPLNTALTLVAANGNTLSRLVWNSLQEKGSLVYRKSSVLPGSQNQDFFSPDLTRVVEIHKKIRDAVLHDEIPDFQVPALVSLMVAGGLTKFILKPEEAAGFKERIEWLANMESLGREIIRTVRTLESADLEKEAAALIGLKHDQPRTFAGGMDAVLSSLSFLYKEAGISRSRKLLANFNQAGGFECPGCAWPNPEKGRSHFEFCENGAKSVSAEATTQLITPDFFKKWSVPDLLLTSGYWLEQQGRLTEPMILDENATHYRPISWDHAYRVVAEEMKALEDPSQAVFFSSGKSVNEAAFLFQLFARAFGTNNLPNSANLCHEPSGKALAMSLGFGKSSVTLNDFPKSEAIFIFGHNPGSNHPRMLSSLEQAVRKGSKIVAVNPMPEASLMGFADPQKPGTYFGKQTALAKLYIQPVINGDMALVRGIVKATLEEEERSGGILDKAFINEYTSGFDTYCQQVKDTPWQVIVRASGVPKDQILEAAGIYYKAKSVIASWCLGIVHHRNAVETIQEIINLLLLRGNIGKPGSGVCPVRGHSNIQGIRTSGAGENMPGAFLDAMENHFALPMPRTPGLSTIPAIRAMAAGKIKLLISLGGNLASSVPDTAFAEEALRSCRLTVMISTKLNRSHLVTGKRALILPCLSRTEEDVRNGEVQVSSIEDAMGKIGFTRGCLTPIAPGLRSEISIITGLAGASLGENQGIPWERFGSDYPYIRATISKTIPAFKNLPQHAPSKSVLTLDNPLRSRTFNTGDKKAHFSNHPLEMAVPKEGELMLMTIRSHDQFNTSIFGLNDRYRGISNERRVLFMNTEDMAERNINPEQMVEISSHYDNKERKMEGYYAIPYPIRRGCAAAYFPETNTLLSINNTCANCETPAYKSVSVTVK
jgi:molybdopterin-dependent oxidoreductase alpha subunit